MYHETPIIGFKFYNTKKTTPTDVEQYVVRKDQINDFLWHMTYCDDCFSYDQDISFTIHCE